MAIVTNEVMDGSVPNQSQVRLDQEKNSAPLTETPLYINGTLKLSSSQGGSYAS